MTTQALPAVSGRDARGRFLRLATEWKQKSKHMSNVAQMAILPSYQRIVGTGWDAVPMILEELRDEPNQWFWALEAITEENPVPSEAMGKARLMADAWVEWGKQRGLIAE